MKPSPAPSTLNTSIGKPGPVWPSSRLSGIAPVEGRRRPSAPRLQTSVASETARTARSAAMVSVDAAGDVELLLGADDQVEEVQRRLQLGGDRGAFDEAALALAMAGQAPEVRAVVDVERGPRAVLAREASAPSAPRPRCAGG